MSKLLKSKKKRRIFVIVITVIALCIAAFFGYIAYDEIVQLIGGETTKDNSRTIESYGYCLRENATDYQMELFDELKEICKAEEIDKDALAISVAKNFVADFFTWDNKVASYDVGGMVYTNESSRTNMYLMARDLVCQNLSIYKEKYGEDNLLEVVSVNAEIIEKSTMDFNGETYDNYLVKNKWEYKEGNILADMLQTADILNIIDNNGRMEIVEIYEAE